MVTYSVTDIGRNRTINQDYVLCEENAVGNLPNLFLVADGMGGHNGGDFASHFCVEMVRQMVEDSTETAVVPLLKEAIRTTNIRLREKAEERPELAGMGTTIVAATIIGDVLHVANVGDSRLYIHKGDKLRQITEDHSLVEAMVRNGELNREEARIHPNKNIITRAMGGHPEVEVDFFEVMLEKEEKILMCSDGLSNMVEDEEMEQVLTRYQDDLEGAAGELVRLANDYGGRDNISVIIIRP